MINIDSNQGRIGEFWWINANPSTVVDARESFPGLRLKLILWGTCGIGRNIRIAMEPIDE